MNFLGLGPMEILLILIVALIIFGPGRLPELASGLGKAIREFRKVSSELTRDWTKEITREMQTGTNENEDTDSKPEVTKREESN
jgi:TatA/E family protein of Tat protein translocase